MKADKGFGMHFEVKGPKKQAREGQKDGDKM